MNKFIYLFVLLNLLQIQNIYSKTTHKLNLRALTADKIYNNDD